MHKRDCIRVALSRLYERSVRDYDIYNLMKPSTLLWATYLRVWPPGFVAVFVRFVSMSGGGVLQECRCAQYVIDSVRYRLDGAN